MAIVVGGVAIDLEANAAEIVGEMERAARATLRSSQQMQGGLSRWGQSFNRAEQRAQHFGSRINRIMAGVGRTIAQFGAIGVGIGAGGFALLAKNAVTSADAIAKAADRAGISTKAYQELAFAASQTGLSQQDLNTTLLAFARRTELARGGTGEMVKLLERLDPALLKSLKSATSQEQALRFLADAMASTSSQSQRLAILQAAMSEAGRKAVLLFSQGADGLDRYADTARRFGLVIDENLLRGAEGANDAIDLLSRSIQARLSAAILQAAPQIQEMATSLAGMVPDLAGAAQKVIELARGFSDLFTSAKPVTAQLKELSGLEIVQGGLLDRMIGLWNDLIDSTEGVRNALGFTGERARQIEDDFVAAAGASADFATQLDLLRHKAQQPVKVTIDTTSVEDPTSPAAPGVPEFKPFARDLVQPKKKTEQFGLDIISIESGGPEALADQLDKLRAMAQEVPRATEPATASIEDLANHAVVAASAAAGLATAMQAADSGNLVAAAGAAITSFAGIMSAAISAAAAVAALQTASGDFTSVARTIAAGAAVVGALITTIGTVGAATQGRARGGGVEPGRPYIVGEDGPELRVFSRAGSIVPNDRLGGGGGSLTLNVDARGAGPGVGAEIRRTLRGMKREIAEMTAGAFADDPGLRRSAVR